MVIFQFASYVSHYQRVTIINHGLTIFYHFFTRVLFYLFPTTVNIHDMLLMWKSTIYTWWFSIVMLVITRGYPLWFSHVLSHGFPPTKKSQWENPGAQGPQGFIHHTVGSGVAQAVILLGANMAEDGLRWVNYMSTFSILVIPCQHLSPHVCFGSNAPRNAKQPHFSSFLMRAMGSSTFFERHIMDGWRTWKKPETMYIAEDRV